MAEEMKQSPEDMPGDSQEAEDSSQPAVDERLDEAMREKEQFKRLAQRAQADLVNYRNRVQIEKEELQVKSALRVSMKFIEVADQMEKALAPEASSGVDSQWVEGVKAIYQNLLNVLASEGFERFDAHGEDFDPRRHDALLATPTPDHAPNTVIRQLTAGYMRNGEVVRPAQVEIAAPAPE
jgi:molecular chaperone GrpE